MLYMPYRQGRGIEREKFVHKPAGEKCVNCHSPHAGEYKYNFKLDGSRDCVDAIRIKRNGSPM